MGATGRAIGWLQHAAAPLGILGAVLLVLFWNAQARGGIPLDLAAPLHLATAVALTLGVLGHQLAHGTQVQSWVGWAGTAAVAEGFMDQLPLLCAGLAAFGVSVARSTVHRHTTGALLAAGAALLLVSWTSAPGFGTEAALPLPWRLLMAAGLLLVGSALTDLGVAAHEREHALALLARERTH